MGTYEGWQFAAARTAAGLSYLDIAKKGKLAVQTIANIESMPQIIVSERKTKGAVTREVLDRLIAVFEKAGFRLVPATVTKTARVEKI
jgi:hypothetical protein